MEPDPSGRPLARGQDVASWDDVIAGCSDLGGKVHARFEAHGLALIATIRKDGGPRISGVEVTFGAGELWLGMMQGSLKAKDLLRDPRFALHSATIDKDVKAGDAKVSGVAVPVDDEATFRDFLHASGPEGALDPGAFHLFRLEVTEMSFVVPAGDHLAIEWWGEGRGYRNIARH